MPATSTVSQTAGFTNAATNPRSARRCACCSSCLPRSQPPGAGSISGLAQLGERPDTQMFTIRGRFLSICLGTGVPSPTEAASPPPPRHEVCSLSPPPPPCRREDQVTGARCRPRRRRRMGRRVSSLSAAPVYFQSGR